MIIVGYQGIGKSSVAGKNDIIDLESNNFFHRKQKPKHWYIYYCNIAEHLSKQGYIVLISSHEVVRKHLRKHCKEPVYSVFPSVDLRKEWIDRLTTRYERTRLEKDFKALVNTRDCYEDSIKEMKRAGFKFFEIRDMEYRLEDIIDYLVAFDAEWNKK